MTQVLFAGDAEGEVRLWDVPTRRALLVAALHGRSAGVLGLAWAGPNRLLTQGRDGEARVWALLPSGGLSPSPLAVVSSGCHHFTRLSVLEGGPDGGGRGRGRGRDPTLVAMCAEEPCDVALWDLGRCSGAGGAPPVLRIRGPAGAGNDGTAPRMGMCMAVKLFDDPGGTGPRVLAGYEDGTVALWCDVGLGRAALFVSSFGAGAGLVYLGCPIEPRALNSLRGGESDRDPLRSDPIPGPPPARAHPLLPAHTSALH